MEWSGEEEAMRAKAKSSVMLTLFSWTEAAPQKKKNPAPKYSVTRAVLWFCEKPQKLLCQDGRFV